MIIIDFIHERIQLRSTVKLVFSGFQIHQLSSRSITRLSHTNRKIKPHACQLARLLYPTSDRDGVACEIKIMVRKESVEPTVDKFN